MKKQILKTLLCVTIPFLISFILLIIASLIILKTGITENSKSIFMTIISAVASISMTVLFVKASNIKPIICSIFSFILMIIIKLILTVILSKNLIFSLSSIISILFIFIFCIIGGLIGVNTKK